MKCPNCKNEIDNSSVFCEHCGARVKQSKIGLWITLSVVFVAIITAFIVTTILEQQRIKQHLESQLITERKARKEIKRKAELLRLGYIDLGLPSGTVWKNANEGGDNVLYTHDEAVSRFGNQLPTKQELEELKNKCTWTWTGNGYKVTGPSGNSIVLPAAGLCDGYGDVDYVGMGGIYWSSTPGGSDGAWTLEFDSIEVYDVSIYYRCCWLSVRLVQNL